MALLAPRPVRLGLSFFLSTHLNAPPPAGPNSVPATPPPAVTKSVSPNWSRGHSPVIQFNSFSASQPERSIEDLAANIRLDDEPSSSPSAPVASPIVDKSNNHPVAKYSAEEGAVVVPPPRSPESAVLDEFLSILRPVIRAPSSPIARLKRLVPRSRHNHHSGAGPSAYHPYARSLKSSSPQDELAEGTVSLVSKKAGGRSSAGSYALRRSSNANDSSHSGGSTSICSSRSQSISRRGSEGSVNAWRANLYDDGA